MKESGTYFDYQYLRFKRQLKYMSTSRGVTIFRSLDKVKSSELWTHGHRIHIFFPHKNFMDETTKFYGAFVECLRRLQIADITNPPCKFILHFMDEDEDQVDAFLHYLESLVDMYFGWRDKAHPDADPCKVSYILRVDKSPTNRFRAEYHQYNRIGVGRNIRVDSRSNPQSFWWELYQDEDRGTWDIRFVFPDYYGNEMYVSMLENIDIMQVVKKTKKKDVEPATQMSKSQAFAIEFLKQSISPVVLEQILSGKEVSSENLFVLMESESSSQNVNALRRAYQKITQAMDQVGSIDPGMIASGLLSEEE